MIAWLPLTRAAVSHAVTTRESLVAAFAELYPAGWNALQEQHAGDVDALGEVVAVYHEIGEIELILSAGIELTDARERLIPPPPLSLLEFGGCEAGRIDHFGPYRFADLRRTQAELEASLADAGRTPSGMVVERYLTLPAAEPDQSKWCTEIWLPLA